MRGNKSQFFAGMLMVAGLSLTGCQSDEGDDVIAVENNDLGITQLAIDHGSLNGERVLTLRGLDDHGAVIATATLRTGMVWYGADMPEDWHAGTELTVGVGDARRSFTSPDREAHELSALDTPALATFVGLRDVAEAISDEAGIRFAHAHPPDEVSFAAGTCSGINFPTSKGNSSMCCKDGGNLYHVPTASPMLAWRTVSTACRTSSGATGCTSDCYYGPCGAHIETVPSPNTSAAKVFVPTSAPTQCGRDSNGTAAGGGMQLPEAYVAQSTYAGVTASCNYDSCRSNGMAFTCITQGQICFQSYQCCNGGQCILGVDGFNTCQ